MIYLKPINFSNINSFSDTVYNDIPFHQKQEMILESMNKIHNNSYFEILVVYNDNSVVGFMNLYAHSKHIISCGPAIKSHLQRQGFGFKGETLALNYAKEKGFTIAVGDVFEKNIASIALHEKLGFEQEIKYIDEQNRIMRLYVKSL